MSEPSIVTTESAAYAERLARLQSVWWKRVLPAQAPYRWNLRRLEPGFTLDIGCGVGRSIANIGGNGVGVDHNPQAVELTRARGYRAFTPDEFLVSGYARPSSFDSLLLSHVAEHMTYDELVTLLRRYLPALRPGGKVILITPQEVGFRSDRSHVTFMDFDLLDDAGAETGITKVTSYSFPLPRPVGRFFVYNEFVWVGVADSPVAQSASAVGSEMVAR